MFLSPMFNCQFLYGDLQDLTASFTTAYVTILCNIAGECSVYMNLVWFFCSVLCVLLLS